MGIISIEQNTMVRRFTRSSVLSKPVSLRKQQRASSSGSCIREKMVSLVSQRNNTHISVRQMIGDDCIRENGSENGNVAEAVQGKCNEQPEC
jgi:hypothetical protein